MELIDREETFKHFCEMCDNGQRDCKGDKDCALWVWLADMPIIDEQVVRHGRWIFVGNEIMPDGWVYLKHKCTECDFVTVEAKNFCQNCGSKMDGGDDNVKVD